MTVTKELPFYWKPLIPGIEPWRLYRLRFRGYAVLIGAVSGYFAAVSIEEKQYLVAYGLALVAISATLFELVVADLLTKSRYPASTQALLRRLEIDYQRVGRLVPQHVQKLIDSLTGCDRSKVRGTVHLRVPLNTLGGESEEALLQLTGYTGPVGGGAWRFTPASKGIIGRCMRTERLETVSFSNDVEYREKMVTEFGFSLGEAKSRTTTGRSYLAQPIVSEEKLVGVLYLFSTEVQVFPGSVDTSKLECAASNIASFLEGAVNLSELPTLHPS